MATTTVVPLPRPRKVPMTAAERKRAQRARDKAWAENQGVTKSPQNVTPVVSRETVPDTQRHAAVERGKRAAVTRKAAIGFSTAAQRLDAGMALTAAAWASALVGMTMNGWYARSLGSSDVAGWLFLAIGVVADVAALFLPVCLARVSQRVPQALGWAVWFATFVFAVTAGVGFASVNISDVTASRASRVTPAIVTAQRGLDDSAAARDRECKGGVGKYCREREAAVAAARAALDAAQREVKADADPQVAAVTHLVTWVTRGALVPDGDDFAMLRLVLLALLPQAGGILLMVGRGAR